MVEAVPTRDYAGAAVIFSAAAVLASLIILPGPDLIASAGLSAAVSCYFLRPIARILAAHQYVLRPFIMGSAVVLLSHLLFGLIAVPVSELRGLLTDEGYRFDVSKALRYGVVLSYFGLFLCFITVPIGILAAYCVEIFGWFRQDARDRRHRAKVAE